MEFSPLFSTAQKGRLFFSLKMPWKFSLRIVQEVRRTFEKRLWRRRGRQLSTYHSACCSILLQSQRYSRSMLEVILFFFWKSCWRRFQTFFSCSNLKMIQSFNLAQFFFYSSSQKKLSVKENARFPKSSCRNAAKNTLIF